MNYHSYLFCDLHSTALGNIIVFSCSGKLSWEQVLRYASLRKKYISLYASLLKSDPDRVVIDDDKDVEKLDRELDIEIILQWRYIVFLLSEGNASF